ncbi:MAG: c-type cytochrome, partial [Simkania sp.]|nr:c-type cytochrome [Simkania sp.]
MLTVEDTPRDVGIKTDYQRKRSYLLTKKESGLDVSEYFSAHFLNKGKSAYTNYCRACHGTNGDGNGPAAKGLRPQPRDFRLGTIKYGSVKAGSGYANQEDFHRIVINGLNGSAMLPWDISEERLDQIMAYIKTLSPEGKGWKNESAKIGDLVNITPDPFAGKDPNPQAIEMGKQLYHGLADCASCHPAYATKDYIYLVNKNSLMREKREYRKNMYLPELKYSQEYGFGILPLDFTYHKIRAGNHQILDRKVLQEGDVKELISHQGLFRTIGAGIGGTAMPAWQGSIPDKFIWAIAYYIKHLATMSPEEVRGLQDELKKDESRPLPDTISKGAQDSFAKSSLTVSTEIMEELKKLYGADEEEGDDDDDDDDGDDD